MGASLCSSYQSSSHKKLSRKSSDDQNAGLVATSIINFMKPSCFRINEEKDQQLQPLIEAKARTLAEWLLASPSLDNNCSNEGEYYVYGSLSPNVLARRYVRVEPGCLRIDEKREQQLQPVNDAKARTLEEWLQASPSLDSNCSDEGEYFLYKSTSPKVHVSRSVYVDEGDYMSDSLERLLKVDEVEDEESSRSQSGKANKKVSFKLPEAADIFTFYSPAAEEFGK